MAVMMAASVMCSTNMESKSWIAVWIYSVSQKKVAPLKLFAIFSLVVNLCD